MKKYILSLLLLGGVFSSCNDSLTVLPTGEISKGEVFKTTENVFKALNGINYLTQTQYLESQGFNGEGTIKLYYGEYTGNNFVKDLPGWKAIINHDYLDNTSTIYGYYPWYYYYKLIGEANVILDNVDAAEGVEEEKNEIKARALSYRAYSYLMMSQIYCKRWSDSNNGASKGLVLKLGSETEVNQDLSTLGEVYKVIYDDLDAALKFYGDSPMGGEFYDMSKSAAYAIYARAALTREDFEKAAEMAKLARVGHPLMSAADYLKGFSEENSEWIWGSYGGTDRNIYFFSYHANMAYSSSASIVRLYPNMITKELYQQIPTTDIRRNLWLYNGKSSDTPRMLNAKDDKDKALIDKARGDFPAIKSNAQLAHYMQLKFKSIGDPGVGPLIHIRSSEMYLIEAEALVRQNKGLDADAQKLMVELIRDSKRDPSYSTSQTGQNLLEEIWTYRGIELWGEGFDWFDMKRTNRSIERTSRATGGSYISSLDKTITPSEHNGWCWAMPEKETDYNHGILPTPKD